MTTVFNFDNKEWEGGFHPLLLGEAPALYDSINVTYPKIFQFYKDQKAADWSEDEVDLEQSRLDMLECPVEIRDLMLENLAYQWGGDSVAVNSLAPVLAPFITNNEYWTAILRIADNEALHALTYSEIVRRCIADPNEIFNKILKSDDIKDRLTIVADTFAHAKKIGAMYVLGMVDKDTAYDAAMKAISALYCLERLQFVDSFTATFAIVEQQWFQGIGVLVQKIMNEERFIHAELGRFVLRTEFKTERGKKWLEDNKQWCKELVDGVVQSEYSWNDYLFSNGRKCVGFTKQMGIDNIDYNAQDVYPEFGLESPTNIKKHPVPFMKNWLDLNKRQNAQQEGDSANYALNIIYDDLGDEVIDIESVGV